MQNTPSDLLCHKSGKLNLQRKQSHPALMARLADDQERKRFWSKVEIHDSGCWIWTSSKNPNGYGVFMVHRGGLRKAYKAHRWSFEVSIGTATHGLDIHHKCNNRLCVNPLHLAEITHRQNLLLSETQAKIQSQKTHCKHGHLFSQENTRMVNGYRYCIICIRAIDRRKYLKRKGKKAPSQPAGRPHSTTVCCSCSSSLSSAARSSEHL